MRTVLLGTSTNITGSTSSTSGLKGHVTMLGDMTDVTGTTHKQLTYNAYLDQLATLCYWYPSYPEKGIYFSVGSDNITATEDDYNLKNGYLVGTDFSVVHRPISNAQIVNGKAVLTFNVTFTAINDITIGEIGMFKEQYYSTAFVKFLFGRIALDTRIELGAGESATFQVSIEI